MKQPVLVLFALLLWHACFSQNDSILEKIEIPQDSFRNFVASPSLSANLIGKNQLEVNFFNILSTRALENRRINANGDTTFSQNKFSRFEQNLQLQYGISKDNRINVGLDLYMSHARTDSDINSSAFRVLGNNETGGMSERAISAFGPRIRWMPFKSLPEFSVQTSYIMGLGSDVSQQMFGRDRNQVLAQFSFYQRFIQRLYLFASLDVSLFLRNEQTNNKDNYSFPLFLFGSYNILGIGPDYPKLYGIASVSYAPQFIKTPNSQGLESEGYESFFGLGSLLQLNPQFGITLWGLFPMGYDLDSLNTQVINGSWYNIALGLRFLYLGSQD